MNMERQLREEERIRAGYYQQHNYTWQYVLQPEEYQDLLSREVNGKHLQIYPFHPKNNWTDFIRFKEGPAGGTVIPVLLQCSPLRWFIPT